MTSSDQGEFDVEKLRNPYESNSEWRMRRNFLQTHHDKMEEDRLVCLANCFINVEVYGCRYPDPVMRQLKELAAQLPELEKPVTRQKGVQKITFVKASTSDGTETQRHKPPPPGFSFVKAESEFQSTDIALNQSHTVQNLSAAATTGNKLKAGLGSSTFKTSSQQCTAGNLNSQRNEMDEKFEQLAQEIKARQAATQKSATEILHMAVDKCKMQIVYDFRGAVPSGGVQMGFVCNLEIDCVSVCSAAASNKKTAKHDASSEAVRMLTESCVSVTEQSPGKFALTVSSARNNTAANPGSGRGIKRQGSGTELAKFPGKKVIKSQPHSVGKQDMDLSQFIIIDQSRMIPTMTEVAILSNSASFNRTSVNYDFEADCSEVTFCHVSVGGQYVATGEGTDKTSSKAAGVSNCLQALKRTCFTLIVKQQMDTDTAGLTKDKVLSNLQEEAGVIPDSNVGNMLLRKMGWVGGGVGKDGTGRAEPVKAEQVIGRSGLGLAAAAGVSKDFNSRIHSMLSDYIKSDNQDDLHFSPEFTKEERAMIHKACQKYHLKSSSHGKADEGRFLIVSRKRSAQQLVNHVLESGGSTSKYDLIPPESIQSSSASTYCPYVM